MANGKISQFLKSNWHYFLFAVAIFIGILCGVRACAKSTPIDIDANRNRIVIQLPNVSMNGKAECPRYRELFRLECRGELPFLSLWEKINHLPPTPLFESVSERKRYSRYIFTRDKPLWRYPPYCRYGYYCKPCILKLCNSKPIQLTLF